MAVGGNIRQARHTAGMTRASASVRAGLARSTWERIEQGTPTVTLAALIAAADAVGLDFVCNTYPGREPGLRDSGQFAIAHWFAGQAHSGWQTTLEEMAGDHGEAIDMVLWGPSEIIAIEIERHLLDWQAQLRRWRLKCEWLAARHSRPVRLVIAVADTTANRRALEPFLSTVHQVLPAGTRAVLAAVRSGDPLGTDGLCWVRTRR
jgi:transcriptional regulator with XRE-family HTH domain